MAAVMASGMVPPLAMALASTVLDKRRFSLAERENGAAAWLLGASFISEGAIPFAAADPFRVIPACMVGGAVTGGLVEVFSVQSRAPHGGVFVFFAISSPALWIFAIAVGSTISAFLLVTLKRFVGRGDRAAGVEPDPVPAGQPVAGPAGPPGRSSEAPAPSGGALAVDRRRTTPPSASA